MEVVMVSFSVPKLCLGHPTKGAGEPVDRGTHRTVSVERTGACRPVSE